MLLIPVRSRGLVMVCLCVGFVLRVCVCVCVCRSFGYFATARNKVSLTARIIECAQDEISRAYFWVLPTWHSSDLFLSISASGDRVKSAAPSGHEWRSPSVAGRGASSG